VPSQSLARCPALAGSPIPASLPSSNGKELEKPNLQKSWSNQLQLLVALARLHFNQGVLIQKIGKMGKCGPAFICIAIKQRFSFQAKQEKQITFER
jgi:hypothetical protein